MFVNISAGKGAKLIGCYLCQPEAPTENSARELGQASHRANNCPKRGLPSSLFVACIFSVLLAFVVIFDNVRLSMIMSELPV